MKTKLRRTKQHKLNLIFFLANEKQTLKRVNHEIDGVYNIFLKFIFFVRVVHISIGISLDFAASSSSSPATTSASCILPDELEQNSFSFLTCLCLCSQSTSSVSKISCSNKPQKNEQKNALCVAGILRTRYTSTSKTPSFQPRWSLMVVSTVQT